MDTIIHVVERVNNELPVIPSKEVEIYHYKNIAIFRPQITLNIPAYFSSYHFIITGNKSNMPPFIIDNKIYTADDNRLFSVNPGQRILSTVNKTVNNYTALYIDKDYMNELSMTIDGKDNLFFSNDGCIVTKRLIDAIRLLIHEYKKKEYGHELMLETLCTQITVEIIRSAGNNKLFIPINQNCSNLNNINKSLEFMKDSYSEDFSLKDLAKIANLSPFHFIMVFKFQTGKTPYEYLLYVRIEKAMEMLKEKQNTITEISLQCGFKSQSYFSSAFKKITGISPSCYRNLNI